MKLSTKRWLRAVSALSCLSMGAFINAPAQSFKWAESGAQSDDNQYATGVSLDDVGNSYVVGFFNSYDVGFDNAYDYPQSNTGATGTEDGFLAKYDKDGVVLWSVLVGSTGNDRCTNVSAFHHGNEDDNIYVIGTFNGTVTVGTTAGSTINLTSSGGQDSYVAKYDINGVLKWAYDIGGTGTDYAYSISANDDGSNNHVLYIAGKYASNTSFKCYYNGGSSITPTVAAGYGSDDGYLVKYIDNGTNATASWLRTMGSTNPDAYYCVASNSGHVSVGGQIRGNTTIEKDGVPNNASLTLSGSYDAIVVNYTSSGTWVWSNRYGTNSTSNENATSMAIDENNNTYFGGFFGSTGTGSPISCTSGGWEAYVMCANYLGTTSWASCGGTTNDDYVQGIAVDKCSKRVYAVGVYKGSFTWGSASLSAYHSGPDNDGFMLSLDAGTGSYVTGTANSMGGTGDDHPYAIATNRLNRICVVGTSAATNWDIGSTNYYTNPYAPTGNYDSFLARWIDGAWPALPSAGSSASHKGLTISSCNLYAGGTMAGSATFGGTTLSSTLNSNNASSDDIYMTQADRFGNYNSFVKVVDGTSNEYLNDQVMDGSGNLYLAGYANTGAAGNTITFNTSPSATNVACTFSGPQALLCQTNSSGVTQWYALGQSTGSAGQAWANGVALDGSGYVYICGSFEGSVKFDASTTLTAVYEDAFIAKYSTAGVFQWARDVANGSTASITVRANGICADQSGNVYITGSYAATTNFNTATTPLTLTTAGGNANDIFVAQYGSTGYAQKVLSYTGSTHWDQGSGITCVNSQAIYVTGYSDLSSPKTFTGKCTMSGSATWSWTSVASGSASYGNRVVTDGTNVFVTGLGNNGSVFGPFTLSLAHASPYVVSYAAGNGTVGFASARIVDINNAVGYAIALDNVGAVNNVFIDGDYPAFIEQVSSDVGNYARLANPNTNETQANSLPVITQTNIFPNPSDGSMTLQLSGTVDENNPVSLLIVDLSGRVVVRKDGIVAQQTPIDGQELANGVYCYEIVRDNVVIDNGKIVIAK